MEKLTKLVYRAWMWIAHHFGAEKQMIPSLHNINAEDVKLGRPYEWYGRIVKAKRNYLKTVTEYTIIPHDMCQEAVDLICMHTDELVVKDTMYTTTNEYLGEALKKMAGVTVVEETKNLPCRLCCMQEKGLPCPCNCDFKRYWEMVAEYKQYYTDQEAYMRTMQKRINRK